MFVFSGIDPTYKVPRYLAQIIFGAGNISASSAPLYTLYIGYKTAAGSMVADDTPVEVTSGDDVNAKAGARSLLAQMARAGIKAAPTARHFIAAITEPAGTAATATLTIGGTWSTPGEWALEVAGTRIGGAVAATDTIDIVGADMKTKVDNKSEIPIVTTGAFNTGTKVLTLTVANTGTHGNDWILKVDKSKLPAGMTIALAGSATLAGDRVRFGATPGVGTPDITALLTKLQTTRFARIVSGFNDATTASALETHVNDKATMTRLILEHVIFGHNSASSSVYEAFGKTQTNSPRIQVVWMRNSPTHPAVVAAVNGAIRATTESAEPVPDYDGKVLTGIPPHNYDGDIPLDAEINSALNSGVTPVTTVNGEARIVRAVTSYCRLDANTQDERCLDIGDAVMTDYATVDLKLYYETTFRPNNKYVGPDPATGENEPPPGVAYPRQWNSAVQHRLQTYADNGWIESPQANPPTSQYNKDARAIESLIPLVVRRVQHQMRNIIRQTAP